VRRGGGGDGVTPIHSLFRTGVFLPCNRLGTPHRSMAAVAILCLLLVQRGSGV
jgi:hypothetical protein